MLCPSCKQDAPYLWPTPSYLRLAEDTYLCIVCTDRLSVRHYYKRASRTMREAVRRCAYGKTLTLTIYYPHDPHGWRWPVPLIRVHVDRSDGEHTFMSLDGIMARALESKALDYVSEWPSHWGVDEPDLSFGPVLVEGT